MLTDCENDRLLSQWLSGDDRTSLVKLLMAHLARPDPDVRFASLLAGSVVNMGGGRQPEIIRALMSVLELCWKFDGLAGLVELGQYVQQAQQQDKISGKCHACVRARTHTHTTHCVVAWLCEPRLT
jgi:hypothetical protein